jgi:AraC-like DNA-binding protein
MIQNSFKGMGSEGFPTYPSEFTESDKGMLEHLVSHLSLSPISATHYHCTSEWRLFPRKLQNSYWTLLINGHGTIKIEDKVYRVGPGDMIFFPEGVLHSFDHRGDAELEMINVHFHAKVYGLMDFLRLKGIQGVFHDTAGFPELISRELARAYALKPPSCRSFMVHLIESLLLYVLYNFQEGDSTGISGFKQLLKLFPALEMIEQRLEDPDLKQADLAAKLRISEVYLRKMFKGLFDESPVKFINHRRIERACKLLRESDLPVKAVVEKSGFRNLQFFYRVFVRITSLTPASYRNTSDF